MCDRTKMRDPKPVCCKFGADRKNSKKMSLLKSDLKK